MIIRFILILLLAGVSFGQELNDPFSVGKGGLHAPKGRVFAVDLDGSTEYMSNASPTNLDLNDTNRVVLDIDNDFELGTNEVPSASSNFATDGTGWWTTFRGVIAWNEGAQDMTFTVDEQGFLAGFFNFDELVIGSTFKFTWQAKSSNETSTMQTDVNDTQVEVLNPALGVGYQNYEFIVIASSQNSLTVGFKDNNIPVDQDLTIDDIVVTEYPSWTGTGNHSFSVSSVNPLTGSYSGLISSTGAGDSTTNYASLPNDNYTVPTAGLKYTFQWEVQGADTTAGDSVYVHFGTTTAGWVLTEAKQTLVYNWGAVAGDTLLYAYINTANDTIRIDEVDLSEAYDVTVMVWVNKDNNTATDGIFNYGGTADGVNGYHVYWTSTKRIRARITDGVNSSGIIDGTGVVLEDSLWTLVTARFDRDGVATIRTISATDDHTSPTVDISSIGAIRPAGNLQIGGWIEFGGYIGETQIVRGQILTASEILTAYNLGQAGKHFLETGNEAGWWIFAGTDNATFLSDETGNNNLTGTNVTQSADQVKLNKYKD